jgi:signal transduction histidine kinase
VADSGIGIAEADLDHIFDRFWRADKVRSRGAGDAGLGPSIERWIVDRHHGKITVKSELGKRHDITVTLPTIEIPRQEA